MRRTYKHNKQLRKTRRIKRGGNNLKINIPLPASLSSSPQSSPQPSPQLPPQPPLPQQKPINRGITISNKNSNLEPVQRDTYTYYERKPFINRREKLRKDNSFSLIKGIKRIFGIRTPKVPLNSNGAPKSAFNINNRGFRSKP